MTGRCARVLIVAGEASGDLYGSLVMRAMQGKAERQAARNATGGGENEAWDGRVQFIGIGGPSMRAAGLRPLGDAGLIGVTGFLEVLGSARAIWNAYREARGLIDSEERPDLALLIDYPDFNIRLAQRARRAGVPVLYFVSPQVWAWRKGRVRRIATVVRRMLVILPFEEELYRKAGVSVEFVGHPLLDLVRTTRTREQTLRPAGLDPLRPTVALLPGSRMNELRAHLAIMLAAARRLREEFRDLQFLIPIAPTLARDAVEGIVREERREAQASGDRKADLGCVLLGEDRYDAVAACDAAVVASGTATLETALLEVPMVIVYRMNPLTFALARLISDVPHVGMPNLIAGSRIVPELVQGECTPQRISHELRRILTDPTVAATMRRDLSGVRSRLGAPGAIDRVARSAWDMIGARERTRVA
ncbi:MAG TPA: lipid-A-disaccharide synthase [Candidatus Polarisedimenticolia bacterium]|nr:lipid-A-disaccharide synthase [Candidatus Polarisedimenticolia bacterium]